MRGAKSGFRNTINLRRNLRKKMTAAEKLFWAKVSSKQLRGLKFRRQHGIGNFIVDFYCPAKKLIIEIDGDSHAETENQDEVRTNYLNQLGYRVVRYKNSDIIENINGVFEDLINEL